MIYPHIIEDDKEISVEAWVKCPKCNNAYHRILPGKLTPYWYCQDEKQELKAEQEIEIEYITPVEEEYYAS